MLYQLSYRGLLSSPQAHLNIQQIKMRSSFSHSSIKIDPSDTLLFKSMLGNKTSSALTIKNLSENTICFKVKTSSPKEFLVTPINGTIHSLSDAKVSISFVGPPENKNKGQKFLIEICQAADVSVADWKSGVIQYKLGTHFLVSEDQEEQVEKDLVEERRPSASIYGEAVEDKEPSIKDEEVDEKKLLTSKNSELGSKIEQLRAQIENISHKLKFSKDIETINAEIGGKYSVPHLILMFVVGVLVGYYVLG